MNCTRLVFLALAATTAACVVEPEPPPPRAYVVVARPPPPPPPRPAPPPPLAPPAPAPPVRVNIVALGCFKDQGDPGGTRGRDLDGVMVTESDMTTESCASICASRGFAYAGTQDSTQCFCGSGYGRSGPSGACNYKCGGNPSQTCGGFWANSVYQVRP
jgi:hypothetical protein